MHHSDTKSPISPPAPVVYHSGLKAYKLHLIPNLHSDEGQRLYGQCVYTDEVVQLNEDISPKLQRIAFCHEIVHDWMEQGGHKQDEDLIRMLGYKIAEMFLRPENQSIIDWLQARGVPPSQNELSDVE